jgi:polyphenol oxidase
MSQTKTGRIKKRRRPTERLGSAARHRAESAGSQSGWRLRNCGELLVLEAAAFRNLPWLVHGFSTRAGGVSRLDGKVLNLGFTDWDRPSHVLENRKRFQHAVGGDGFELITVQQIHSDVVHAFERKPRDPGRGDALVTGHAKLLLAVQTADCVPILLVDRKTRAVAAVHAGWRGTLARIVQKTVGQMQMRFGSEPRNLLAALGPAIGGCCYHVGGELVTQFTSQFAEARAWFDELRTGEEPDPLQWLNMMPPGHQPPPDKVRLDLRKANRAQLIESGLPGEAVFVSDLCTACRPDLFFSYRKQGPSSGRLLAAIGIRE